MYLESMEHDYTGSKSLSLASKCQVSSERRVSNLESEVSESDLIGGNICCWNILFLIVKILTILCVCEKFMCPLK